MQFILYLPRIVEDHRGAFESYLRLQYEGEALNKRLTRLRDPDEQLPYQLVWSEPGRIKHVIQMAAVETRIITLSIEHVLDIPAEELKNELLKKRHIGIDIYVVGRARLISVEKQSGIDYLDDLTLVVEAAAARKEKKARNFGAPDRSLEKSVVDEIKKLRGEGRSLGAISRELGVSYNSAKKYAKGVKKLFNEEQERAKRAAKLTFDYEAINSYPYLSDARRSRPIVTEFLKLKYNHETKKRSFQFLSNFFKYWSETFNDSKPINDFSAITSDHFSAYLSHKKTTMPEKSLYIEFTVIRSFFKYLINSSYITMNPAAHVIYQHEKPTRISKDPLSDEDLGKLISYAEKRFNSEKSKERRILAHRNFILIYLLASTGLRISSALSLRKCDIEVFKEKVGLAVTLKGRKGRSKVYMAADIYEPIATYISKNMKGELPEARLFFWSDEDKTRPVSINRFNNILKSYAQRANLTITNISSHSFRTTAADMWMSEGVDPREVQERLCHKSMDTTSLYLKRAPGLITGKAFSQIIAKTKDLLEKGDGDESRGEKRGA